MTSMTTAVGADQFVLAARGTGVSNVMITLAMATPEEKRYLSGRFQSFIYDVSESVRIAQYSNPKNTITKDAFTIGCLTQCANDMTCRGAYVRHAAVSRLCTLLADLGTCTPSDMFSVPTYLATSDESESWWRAGQLDTPTPEGCV